MTKSVFPRGEVFPEGEAVSSLTCEEVRSADLQLEVKLVVHGVDGLLLQQGGQPQLRRVGGLVVRTCGTGMSVPPKRGKTEPCSN